MRLRNGCAASASFAMQHRLYFLPDPQGQGSLRDGLIPENGWLSRPALDGHAGDRSGADGIDAGFHAAYHYPGIRFPSGESDARDREAVEAVL